MGTELFLLAAETAPTEAASGPALPLMAALTIFMAKTVIISMTSLRLSAIASNNLFPDILPNKNKIKRRVCA